MFIGKCAYDFNILKSTHRSRHGRDTSFYGSDGLLRLEISDDDAVLKPYEDNSPPTLLLKDRLCHPLLFKAYPELQFLPVSLLPTANEDCVRGSYICPNGSSTLGINFARYAGILGHVEIKPSLKPQKSILGVLMHEIQHAIQEIEGFSRGTNEEYEFIKCISRSDLMSDATKSYIIDLYNKTGEVLEDGVEDVFSDFEKNLLLNFAQQADNKYQQHPGEVEAKQVQLRLTLTEEERLLAILPAMPQEKAPRGTGSCPHLRALRHAIIQKKQYLTAC